MLGASHRATVTTRMITSLVRDRNLSSHFPMLLGGGYTFLRKKEETLYYYLGVSLNSGTQ